MGAHYPLVQMFVEGRVQNRFLEIADEVHDFIELVSPELERIAVCINEFEKRPIAKVSSGLIAESMRKDLEGARRFLAIYNRMFGFTDHRLALMTTSFKLSDFLAENGIPRNLVYEVQGELREYWAQTYGPELERYSMLHRSLDELRDILRKEIEIMERLPGVGYFDGFDASAQLRVLFHEERKVFYEKIVRFAVENNHAVTQIEALIRVQAKKTKEYVSAYVSAAGKAFGADIANSKTLAQKSLVLLIYLLGAMHMVLSIRSKFLKGAVSKVQRLLIERRMKSIRVSAQKIEKAFGDLATDVITDAVTSCWKLL